jgi:hypothetical protein
MSIQQRFINTITFTDTRSKIKKAFQGSQHPPKDDFSTQAAPSTPTKTSKALYDQLRYQKPTGLTSASLPKTEKEVDAEMARVLQEAEFGNGDVAGDLKDDLLKDYVQLDEGIKSDKKTAAALKDYVSAGKTTGVNAGKASKKAAEALLAQGKAGEFAATSVRYALHSERMSSVAVKDPKQQQALALAIQGNADLMKQMEKALKKGPQSVDAEINRRLLEKAMDSQEKKFFEKKQSQAKAGSSGNGQNPPSSKFPLPAAPTGKVQLQREEEKVADDALAAV